MKSIMPKLKLVCAKCAEKSSMMIRVGQQIAGVGQTICLILCDPNGPLGLVKRSAWILLGSIIGLVDNWAESYGPLECWALLGAH